MLSTRVSRWFAVAACSVFFLTGLGFVPRLGLQNDEAYFAVALLPPRAEVYALTIRHHQLPLMLMSYLGTLKSWIYRPLIRAFGTGVWATRVPMLLAGALSVWLFYRLLRRIAGGRAAVIGCGLLATDAVYLLTSCFDWGPVALQHLLITAGLLLFVRFWQERRDLVLASGFFLFGLALWDKALAVWMLGSMAMAALAIFPRPIAAVFTPRRAGIALVAFILGAFPLIVYNVNTRGGTLHGTAAFDTSGLPHKALILRITADGSGLFNEMINEDRQTVHPHAPEGGVQRASAAVAALTGHPRHSLLLWAFGLALLLTPLARGTPLRIILFAILSMVLAWGQMAFTAGAGESLHHTILLWPFPQMVIAVSFASASQRLGRSAVPMLAAVLALVIGSGLAVINEYHAAMVRNGGVMDWTDAIFPLSTYLKDTPAHGVFPVDWGIMDSLRLLDRGRLPLGVGSYPISKPVLTPADRDSVDKMISRPDHLFLTHVTGLQFFPEFDDKLAHFAEERGYRRDKVTTIADSYGRPTFEVYRFLPFR